jgi:hypothetical protein
MEHSSSRPQRERLPCLKVGILVIGKIKPTIAVRGVVRLIFSKIQFIKWTSPGFADLDRYQILIGQLIDK